MLMLSGAIKVALIFEEPHQLQPPWLVSAATLRGIDDHFWDWIFWLSSKDGAGKDDFVAAELRKMSRHLLQPLGIEAAPEGIGGAIALYVAARGEAERRCGVAVPPRVEAEVREALREHGYEA